MPSNPSAPSEIMDCLEALRPPVTKDEALQHAEDCGAPQRLLDFLERLPAALFSSHEGLRHVLASIDESHFADYPRKTHEAEDGISG